MEYELYIDFNMQMNDNEHKEGVLEATKLCSFIRGAVINEVAFLEIMLDGFLAAHFCKDEIKKRDFLKVMMQSKIMTFDSKRIVFNDLVKKYYSEFKKVIPNYHSLLGDIRDCRNKLAHTQLDISPLGIENFIKTKNVFMLNSTKESEELKFSEIEKVIYNTKWISNEISKIVYGNRQASPSSDSPNMHIK